MSNSIQYSRLRRKSRRQNSVHVNGVLIVYPVVNIAIRADRSSLNTSAVQIVYTDLIRSLRSVSYCRVFILICQYYCERLDTGLAILLGELAFESERYMKEVSIPSVVAIYRLCFSIPLTGSYDG
jgi:hypothetical protein